MNNSFQRFENNLQSVSSLNNIYEYLIQCKVNSIDLSELLRAEYVLIVSAFDGLVHDLVRSGLIIIFDNDQSDTRSLNNFQISLQTAKDIISIDSRGERANILDNEIRKITSKDSYQSPRSIETALQLLSIKKIWTKIGTDINQNPEDIRKQLGIIINRRNKIAHEADYNVSSGSKESLEKDDLNEVSDFIKKISKSLYDIVKQEITHANIL